MVFIGCYKFFILVFSKQTMMNLQLQLHEDPYVFSLTNEDGVSTFIDANPSFGGKNKGLRPTQLLAGSVAACISIDLLSILRKKKYEFERFEIQIKGIQREEGTTHPFERIDLLILVEEHIDIAMVLKNATLIHDKYCSVASSLDEKIEINLEAQHFLN